MSQQDSDSTQQETSERFGISWVLLFGLIGAVVVALSFVAGKDLSLGEVIYDIGIAIVTLALVDLIILRSLKEFASRPTEQEKRLVAALASATSALTAAVGLNKEMKNFNLEMEQLVEKWERRETEEKIENIEKMLEDLGKEIYKIRVQVDPEYKDQKDFEKRIMDELNDDKE